MRQRLLGRAVCIAATIVLAGTAFAQEDREEEARALFMAGRAAYDAGRYEAALERFQESFELSGRPELLYNIGQTADRLRQDAVALQAFERFLAETPETTANRDVAQRRVEFLRGSAAAGPRPGPDARPDPDPEPSPDVEAPEADLEPTPDLDPSRMSGEDFGLEDSGSAPAPIEEESSSSKWWIGVIVGVVVVGLAVGLAVGLSGGSDPEPQYAESDLGRTIFALGEWR